MSREDAESFAMRTALRRQDRRRYRKIILTFLLAAASGLAQTAQTAPEKPPAGSISGVVKDADSGAPVGDTVVGLRAGTKAISGKTDAAGHYSLRDVPPGSYLVFAMTSTRGGPEQSRMVTIGAGQDLTSIDFALRTYGQISGKVLDENKEPVPDMMVVVVAREYRNGALRCVFSGMAAKTDDLGEYTLSRIMPGRPVSLVAVKRDRSLKAVADSPADPKLRKPATIPTFYPDSISPEGAQILTLRSGEHRQSVDFRLRRTPSYCIEGVLEGSAGPAQLSFQIEEGQPSSGLSGSGGTYLVSPGGKSGPDGKVRICDLHPGEYRITANEAFSGMDSIPGFFGVTTVAITDHDLQDIKIPALPQVPVSGVVAWDGAAPEKPVDVKLSFNLRPVARAPWGGEFGGLSASAAIPGEFSFPRLLMDDYELTVSGVPNGLYIKDVTYGANSVFHQPLHPGSAIGNAGLRVTVARDGGTIGVRVLDKDGKPVPDCMVTILPESGAPDAAFAALILSAQTDQSGVYTSGTLAPGKYYVLAGAPANDYTPETVAKLRRARIKAKEVELGAGQTAQVTLELVNIE